MNGFSFKITDYMRVFIITALALVVLFPAAPSFSKEESKEEIAPIKKVSKAVSETEKAVFAYFRLSGGVPKYAKWIEGSPEYKNETSMFSRQEIYDLEKARLEKEFEKYDIEKDFIKIKTDILLQLRTRTKTPTLNFKFLNSGSSDTPYFPYAYGDEWLTLLIEDLDDYKAVNLDIGEYEQAVQILRPQAIYKAKIEIHVLPTFANTEGILDVGGIEAWFMTGRVANIFFLYENEETGEMSEVWSHIMALPADSSSAN